MPESKKMIKKQTKKKNRTGSSQGTQKPTWKNSQESNLEYGEEIIMMMIIMIDYNKSIAITVHTFILTNDWKIFKGE